MHCIKECDGRSEEDRRNDRLAPFLKIYIPCRREMSYNSCLCWIRRSKLLDTGGSRFEGYFLENLVFALKWPQFDYLVVKHMEPDHCALIAAVLRMYPQVQIVCNNKTFGDAGSYF